MGNFAKARELLERAFALRPEAEIGAHLGEVLWAMGERDAARRIWRQVAPTSRTTRRSAPRWPGCRSGSSRSPLPDRPTSMASASRKPAWAGGA